MGADVRRCYNLFMDLSATFRALRHKNFRLFIYGQSISLTGTWMQQIAVGWLVYRLTGSAMLLGMTGFLGQLPAAFFSPLAGVFADRYDKRKLLIWVQVLAMIQAALLAALTLSGHVQAWHVIALGVLLGFSNAFDMPVRQSFFVEMIGSREDLPNAIALNSSMVNAARLVGPSLAGIAIASFGEGVCFLLNALSYIAVIAALMRMDITPKERPLKNKEILTELAEGFRYINALPLKYIVLLLGMVSLLGMSYQVLMPVYAKEALGGGPKTLGWLVCAIGVGALTMAVYLAGLKERFKLCGYIPCAAIVMGSAIAILSFSHSLWFSLIFMALAGAGMMTQIAASNTLLQTCSHDHMRGRVMSFYAFSFVGMGPFGSLLAGSVAGWLGVRNSFLLSGAACIIGGLLFIKKLPDLKELVRERLFS